MFDLDALIANKDLILKDRDNRADVQKVLSVYAEKVDSSYVVKAKWSDIFDALLQGMKVQAQVITMQEADEEEETDASAVIETYDLYDATVTANGFSVNGTDLSAASADAYPVGSLSRPSSGGGGGGASVLFVTASLVDNTYVLDHTAGEIIEAMPLVYMKNESPDGDVTFAPFSPELDEDSKPTGSVYYFYDESDGGYNFFRSINNISGDFEYYQAETLDDYPTFETGSV